MDRLTEIPACPDSISTPEARELFMDLCDEHIKHKRLTNALLEAITGYCFLIQVSNITQQAILNHPDDMAWHELWIKCAAREIEYSEIIGLTPLDRKNLGLI